LDRRQVAATDYFNCIPVSVVDRGGPFRRERAASHKRERQEGGGKWFHDLDGVDDSNLFHPFVAFFRTRLGQLN
jgi:hypothetical protein